MQVNSLKDSLNTSCPRTRTGTGSTSRLLRRGCLGGMISSLKSRRAGDNSTGGPNAKQSNVVTWMITRARISARPFYVAPCVWPAQAAAHDDERKRLIDGTQPAKLGRCTRRSDRQARCIGAGLPAVRALGYTRRECACQSVGWCKGLAIFVAGIATLAD